MAPLRFVVDYGRKINDVLDDAKFARRAEARLGVFGSGRHELTAERLVFDEDTTTPRVLARMAEEKLRPATLFELASAAVADGKLGARAMVVALGSCDVNFVDGSASPAIASIEGERTITMTGFCGAWPRGTEFLAIPEALPAGLGDVAHNHLLPITKKRSPKLRFAEPPCTLSFEVPYDGTLALRAIAKQAKVRNMSEYVDDATRFPPGPPIKATLAMTIVTCNRQLRSRDAVAELAARGLRPATVRETLALVAAHGEDVGDRRIVALADVTCTSLFKSSAASRTLAVHHDVDNGPPDSPLASAHWAFFEWFAGVSTGDPA